MLEEILEYYPDETFLKADGFDDAVIGVEIAEPMRLIYSVKKVIETLITEDEMSLEDALEHFEYNIRGSYVGEQTPIWCDDMYEL
jgi:uncharacterized protein YllA (UPF0747 family)